MFDPLISTVSMSSFQAPPSLETISAELTMAPSITTGRPPPRYDLTALGSGTLEANGTAPTLTSNSDTTRFALTICLTRLMFEIARAARCISQNQSYLFASSPSEHTALPAMKNGELRKSWVSEKTSSQVPVMSAQLSAGSLVGFISSSWATMLRAVSFSSTEALSPLEVHAPSWRSAAFRFSGVCTISASIIFLGSIDSTSTSEG
mmetsp:Transcript_18354/g.41925  ORF Transcript_18354/g.41925 Transcript_18354/m.41925 type:complete len:206 (-) Transcript_18354:158-775(-)